MIQKGSKTANSIYTLSLQVFSDGGGGGGGEELSNAKLGGGGEAEKSESMLPYYVA